MAGGAKVCVFADAELGGDLSPSLEREKASTDLKGRMSCLRSTVWEAIGGRSEIDGSGLAVDLSGTEVVEDLGEGDLDGASVLDDGEL